LFVGDDNSYQKRIGHASSETQIGCSMMAELDKLRWMACVSRLVTTGIGVPPDGKPPRQDVLLQWQTSNRYAL